MIEGLLEDLLVVFFLAKRGGQLIHEECEVFGFDPAGGSGVIEGPNVDEFLVIV